MDQHHIEEETSAAREVPASGVPRDCNHALQVLNAISKGLNASLDLHTMLEDALARVAELLDLRTGWVLLLDEDSGEPYLAAAQNLPPGLATEPERMTGGCYCMNTFRQGDFRGAANVNIVTCSRLKQLVHDRSGNGTDGLRYHASIPLYTRQENGRRRLGMLNVASPKWRQLDADELGLLYTIGDMLGIAIERARLHRRSLEAAQAEERNRLAREIHDTLAQGLSAITLQLESAEATLEQSAAPDEVRPPIDAALDLTRKSLEEARRSVLDLRAAPLEGRTLTEALQALVEEQTDEDAAVTFEPPQDRRPLSTRVEVGLYRIAQEALTNARRHAAAQRITIRLAAAPEEVCLAIEDDGRGFDIEHFQEGRPERGDGSHFGLVGLRERARLLGGRLRVESSPGVGTRVEASVPLESARAIPVAEGEQPS